MNRLMYRGFHRDLSGIKFGKLTVIEEKVLLFDGKNHFYLCKCECGNEHLTSSADLKTKKVTSCGCYLKQKSKETMNRLPREANGRLKKKI